jgi:predicted Zn-dependent protease with MMP-like domain
MPIRRRGSLSRRHPDRRVFVPEPSHQPFEALLERALDGLPEPFRRLLESVAVVIEDEPTDEQARDEAAATPYGLYGLYEGTPLIEYAADQVAFPNKITLFRLSLEEDFPDPDELADEVRRTVVHELAHHAGFDERRLGELGFD